MEVSFLTEAKVSYRTNLTSFSFSALAALQTIEFRGEMPPIFSSFEACEEDFHFVHQATLLWLFLLWLL